MTRVFESRTIDDIRIGDEASIQRSLNLTDLRLWAALTGNPGLDEDFVATRGVTTWATSLFVTLIGSSLPGIGSIIRNANVHYHQSVRIGQTVRATITVREIRRDKGIIVLDCRCSDAKGGLMVAQGSIEVTAPPQKIRSERPEHRLEELVQRCQGLTPMATAVVS